MSVLMWFASGFAVALPLLALMVLDRSPARGIARLTGGR